MSDYQRIVSYLYEYSHGLKGPNVGFAKIEKRQKKLRLYFHVKTNDQPLEYKIYFYHFHHGTMEGTLLDTIQRNDTIVEFKNTYPLMMDLNQIDGFLIFHSKDHFFGSEWNDHPITIRNFVPLEKKFFQENPENIPSSEEKEMSQQPSVPESETVPPSAPEINDLSAPEENDMSEDLSVPEENDTSEGLSMPEENNTSEDLSMPEEMNSSISSEELPSENEDADSGLAQYIEALQLEKHAKEQDSPMSSSSFDWKEYPSLPLPPAYGLSPCVKIQLEDLSSISGLPYDIKTNGFLLLNYGNYGHLFLAWNPAARRRYLGVPGVFDNEKSFISKLFGFQEFITVPEKPHKTGNFGYFILPIQ